MNVVNWGLVRTLPEKRDMAAIGAAAEQLGELWGRVDRWLAGRRYLAGDHFTYTDIPLGCFCYRWSEPPWSDRICRMCVPGTSACARGQLTGIMSRCR